MTILRARREARGLTQRQCADLAGLSQQHLSLLERGVVRPSIDTALRLAGALGTDVETLFRPTQESVGA